MDNQAEHDIQTIAEYLRNDLMKAFASDNTLMLIDNFMRIARDRAMVEYDLYKGRKDRRKSYGY